MRRWRSRACPACSISVLSGSLSASILRRGPPGLRAYQAMERAFHDEGIMIRNAGDTIALSPPLMVSEAQIGEIFEKVGRVIKAVA
jgi:adenosylmethionine-8-amino-7-oxononanoate aminotransferase